MLNQQRAPPLWDCMESIEWPLVAMHEMSEYPSSYLEPGRRRLPPTPTRRSSSPRILPTPPPVSPELRPPSASLERPPSRRRLPVPPVVAENDWPVASAMGRKYSEAQPPSYNSIKIVRPLLQKEENSFDHSGGTPSSTNAPSQSSSLSPSMEQVQYF